MLRSLLNVPKESRVLAVVFLTVVIQVLVLSAFGLASLTGQEADAERSLRELSSRVVERYLVEEVTRRIAAEESAAREELAALRVDQPAADPALVRLVGGRLRPEGLLRRAFVLDGAGNWYGADGVLLWPAEPPRAPAVGGDAVEPFESIEAEVLAGGDPDRAIERIHVLLNAADARTGPAGLMTLVRVARRAGRDEEARAACDRLCRDHPRARDPTGLLLGPTAAWHRGMLRIDGLRPGRPGREAIAGDVIGLARILLLNRFQMREDRRWWERRLEALAERAAPLLDTAERVRVAEALGSIREEEEALLLDRKEFGALLERVAGGRRPGGRLWKSLADGPRMLFAVPLADGERVSGAVAFEIDLARLRTVHLPEILGSLPLPEGVAATVVDASGRPVVAGPEREGDRVLAQGSFGEMLPFWSPRALLEDPGILERRTASSRRLHYWYIALAVAGMLAAAWFLVRTVRRELHIAKMKSDFLSNVTHELKTPLTSIRMFVETLQEGRVKDEEERREYLSVIAREADRLSSLIQRVLDLARFEGRRKRTVRRGPADLAEVVRESAEIFRRRLSDGEAELSVEAPESLPGAELDAGAVQELILNLLSNARKYGGKRIRLTATSANGRATIEVEDDGIGIDEREQDRIFDKFYRAEDTLAREVEGSGLGLALVREIAREHGGRVKVRSRKGEGSTFSVTLPLGAG